MKVTELTDLSRLEEVHRLRHDVHKAMGWANTHLRDGKWVDAFDQTARHYVVCHDGRIIASGRLNLGASLAELPYGEQWSRFVLDQSERLAVGTRLVVHPDFRRRGLAKAIDQRRISDARTAGAARMLIATRNPHRKVHLESAGFAALCSEDVFEFGPGQLGVGYVRELSDELSRTV